MVFVMLGGRFDVCKHVARYNKSQFVLRIQIVEFVVSATLTDIITFLYNSFGEAFSLKAKTFWFHKIKWKNN